VCLLVMIGVRAVCTKQLVALADGFRESSQSWADLLRSCRRRGLAAPVLAVGDGALGFWKAVREVFPDTREQRCWFHVSSNVIAALPKSAHPGAKAALPEIGNAEDKDHALKAVKAFGADYGAKWPKAVAKITEHVDVLLVFYDNSAEHWVHLRTTNPIGRDPARGPPESRWRSSSSSPHKPAGAPSTPPTSWLSSVPPPDSRRGNSSNDP
jgi:putative transposase